jgi:UDP-N-acetylmuramoyl-tripeptide--D-alanyl-D-alanine ligase
MARTAASWQDWPQMGWTWEEVVSATGAVASRSRGPAFCAVTTDSRNVPAGALFVALRGPRHDGHAFAATAASRGATGVLADRELADVDPAHVLRVADTLRALGDLAAYTRKREAPRVIAITGSNGKTTTKDMVASICGAAAFAPPRDKVLKTHGNENNLVGLPLNLLRLTGEEAVAVLEMGMNAPGEIARLCDIAAPDVGVITNVGAAHLEGLGSIAGVAKAKGELFEHMPAGATIAVNLDDEWVMRVAAGHRGRRIGFGTGGEVRALAIDDRGFDGIAFELEVDGRRAPVRLKSCGAHNVGNALAAAATAHGIGLDLEAIRVGLERAEPPKMRMQVRRLANGVTVINDAYNANPSSMEAALRALARHRGRGIAVLGEMRELGPDATELHRALGCSAADVGIAVLVAVGPQADAVADGARHAARTNGSPIDVHTCADGRAAADLVRGLWKPGDAVLVKGSRGGDDEEAVRRHGARMAETAHLLESAGDERP